VKFRRLLLLAGLLLAGPLHAQPGELVISSDTSDSTPTESRLIGHARFGDGVVLVTADEIRLDALADTKVVTALGHVIATRGATRILADKLVYHRSDGTFTAERVRLGAYPYYVAGVSASGTAAEVTVNHATVTYGEPGPWQPSLTAEKIIYSPGQRLRTENSRAGIGDVRVLPFPRFTQSLGESLVSHVSVTGGYRRSLGAFIDAGVLLPTAPGLFLGADVGLYSSRGIMVGPAGHYALGPDGAAGGGSFRTGYINDHGDKKTDLLGRPVPEERAFAEWQHTQKLSDQLSINAQLNWWRDSEVLRDFRPRSFFPVQQPDSFIETTYTGRNYFLSAFVRAQPNSFENVQERLPEVRFDLLPTAIGGGLVERITASAAVLRERSLPVGPFNPLPVAERRADRLDAYYALERPIAPTDWFAFTPLVGARITHYANAHTSAADLPFDPAALVLPASARLPLGAYTRTLGEVGFDAALRTSGTFAYKNERWGINGLRHLFTPRLSYRYIPEADKGRAYIPQIDRLTFSPYLPPLGLGEPRNIDDLRATNTLRLALDNTVQTRDATYGSRDLLRLNLAADFRFKRAPGDRDLSEVHTEAGFAPARWLDVDAYSRLTPQTWTMQEFNSGITLHDGNVWSLRFSNNFFRRQIEDYLVDARIRLNETYEALTRLHYDARKRRFNEQSYGLVQNLDHTWRVSYVVSLYSGPRRESHFGLNVQVEAIGF
jgi:LPS-assembly protein